MQKNLFKNKQGILAQFLGVALLIIIVGIFALVFNSLGTGLTGNAQTVMQRGENFSLNISTNFGTAGTLMGVVILLTVVAIVFTVFRNQFGASQ